VTNRLRAAFHNHVGGLFAAMAKPDNDSVRPRSNPLTRTRFTQSENNTPPQKESINFNRAIPHFGAFE